jgi:hypothetical protein
MAITRISTSSLKNLNKYDDALAGMPPKMATPTAADGGTGTTATVSFTSVPAATSYTALSSPGSFTGTGSSSPITVSGLTSGTAYTFQVAGINSNGQGAYSAASNSVTPAVPSSFYNIATVTTSGVSSATFSSIPSTYKSLQIRIMTNDTTQGGGYMQFQINGDTGANYVGHTIYGNGTTVGAQNFLSQGRIPRAGYITQVANAFGVSVIDIIDYASTTKNKTVRIFAGQDINTSGSGELFIGSGLWLSTSAISSITFLNNGGSNFKANTTLALYGVN